MLYKWNGFKDKFDLQNFEFCNFKKKIEFLTNFQCKNLLIFLEDGFIYQVDIQTCRTIKTIEITHLPIRLKSIRI